MKLTQNDKPTFRVRRILSGVLGGAVLIAAMLTVRDLGEQVYYEYYLFPKVKDQYIMPLRWQDITALVLLWGGAILLLYLSYRLLKYAFRHRPAVTA